MLTVPTALAFFHYNDVVLRDDSGAPAGWLISFSLCGNGLFRFSGAVRDGAIGLACIH